jgi:hypothetical protein
VKPFGRKDWLRVDVGRGSTVTVEVCWWRGWLAWLVAGWIVIRTFGFRRSRAA